MRPLRAVDRFVRDRLAGRADVRGFLARPGRADADRMWSRVAPALRAEEPRRFPAPIPARRRAWLRPALAAATLVLAAWGVVWTVRGLRPAEDVMSVRIESVEVGGAPATTIVYQPRGSGLTIVWAARAAE